MAEAAQLRPFYLDEKSIILNLFYDTVHFPANLNIPYGYRRRRTRSQDVFPERHFHFLGFQINAEFNVNNCP
jgi:hypothetical protein